MGLESVSASEDGIGDLKQINRGPSRSARFRSAKSRSARSRSTGSRSTRSRSTRSRYKISYYVQCSKLNSTKSVKTVMRTNHTAVHVSF